MRIELEPSTRDALARALARYLKDEMDVEIGGMDAVLLLDFVSEKLGPHIYNLSLRDAHAHLQDKIEALGDAFYELEKPAKI